MEFEKDKLEYKTFYVGIDLSTQIIGVAIVLKPNETRLWEVHLQHWDSAFSTIITNHKILKEMVNEIKDKINYIRNEFDIEDYKIEIGIELSNFSNAKLTQRFSKYFGIIETYLLNSLPKIKLIKGFNANEWFQHLYKDMNIKEPFTKLERQTRKLLAQDFTKQVLKLDSCVSEDMSDAFCIAWYSHKCRATEAITEDVNAREMLEMKIRKLKRQYKKELMKQKVEKKDKPQRLEKIIEKLELYKKELDNGKHK